MIYALDPGTLQSALLLYDTDCRQVIAHWFELNTLLIPRLRDAASNDTLVIEQVESFGMAVGFEVFETVFWAGRFFQAWRGPYAYRLTRRAVKLHLCQSMKAKDTNIRQALLDKFGGEAAIGRKAAPGALYGLHAHDWAALALAVTWAETHRP